MNLVCDVLIIGAGLAGQVAALRLAEHRKVIVICKDELMQSASAKAQGGISAVYRDPDTYDKHFDDTLIAGCGLNDPTITRHIVENGTAAVQWLISIGVPFTQNDNGYHLTREGGHSERRILHVDDMTGRAIQGVLSRKLRQHPNITVLEHHTALRLLSSMDSSNTCGGAIAINNTAKKQGTITATSTIIATGGSGKIYASATAPLSSSGSGIVLAWNIGCRVANLEFVQFHPTCMYSPGESSFLITEAVRGEGGLLKLPDGSRFMPDYDSRAELAPRDIVARAIYTEMKRLQIPAVLLDISHKPANFIRTHFPNIYQECLRRGIDITKEPIPVQPASHYTCGGVVTDASARTDVAGLYCIGEAAYTGLHGANRLASNSLLECVVMASESANSILSATTKHTPTIPTDTFNQDRALTIFEHEAITVATIELREAMWNYVGIVRSNASLAAAKRRIDQLISEVETLYGDCYPEPDLLDLRHLLTMANLVVRCAQDRKESRGCHFNRDWPHLSQMARPTVLEPDARQSDQVPA